MYFFDSVDECIFLFRSMNVFVFVSVDECIFFGSCRTRFYLHKFFRTHPNPILPTQTFLNPTEPEFTYTNFFGTPRTCFCLHKLFGTTPNQILPTQTLLEPRTGFRLHFFFHIIRVLFIVLFFIVIVVYCLCRFCFCNIVILFILICWYRILLISLFC